MMENKEKLIPLEEEDLDRVFGGRGGNSVAGFLRKGKRCPKCGAWISCATDREINKYEDHVKACTGA